MKKDVPIITNSFRNFAESVLNIDLNLVKQSGSWVNYAKSIGNTDKELLNFLSDVDSGKRNIKDIDSYMNQASSSTAKFSASLKTIAANMAIMLAINIAIKTAVKAWDYVNETVEEQEQKISELSSSIETLQAEYDELSQKQDVTDAEKRRLEYLERRLELDERILKAEQAQLFDEKTGNKFTDLFDKDNLNTQYYSEMNPRNKEGFKVHSLFYDSKMNGIDDIHKQITEWKKLQATVEEGSLAWNSYQDAIDRAQEKETKYIDKLSESESQLTINLGKYADNIEFLQGQLDTGELTEDQTDTAKEQLKVWQDLYDETDAMITQIQKLNGTYDDTAERVARKYSIELNKAKTYLGGYDYSNTGASSTNETGRQISDFWNENVLSGTEEEIEQNVILWQKVTDGITDATVAMDTYIEAKKNGTEIEIDSEPITFDQAWEDSFTSENEEVKKLGDNLLDLAEKGRLTKETFKEADSTGYFKNLGISADEAVSKINKMVDESKQLSSMSSQISSMAEALGTKKENGFVDADTLAGFDVEVRGLESWDRFQSVLGSTTSTYEECQEVANALATEWVNSSDFLAQLTEQNKEYYETQLQDMGVENYEEVIESTIALKEAKEALMDVDLSDATVEDIENLIQEGEYTGLVAEQIWNLYAAKLAEQAAAIDSSSDCQQFLNLANNANLTAESIRLLTELMNIYDGLESGVYDKNAVARTGALAAASSIKAQIEKLASGEGITVKPEVKVDGSKGKKSGGGSKSSKDLHKEAYEKELAELEHMHEMGLLSDADYWQERINLCERYFGESSGMHEKYLDEYRDNEEDILEGLKKLWEDYYDERKNNLKDLISYAEKLYDKEIDSHEATIKKLEERRDAEKKYWEGRINAIGDEIDALEDANDERERAIDIQQKQLALQKAMHQRTMLINLYVRHYSNIVKESNYNG